MGTFHTHKKKTKTVTVNDLITSYESVMFIVPAWDHHHSEDDEPQIFIAHEGVVLLLCESYVQQLGNRDLEKIMEHAAIKIEITRITTEETE